MTTLATYRDDGPLVHLLGRRVGWAVPQEGRLAWLVPPLLRLTEYGAVIAVTATADRGALPACFGFLGAVAFHHYEVVYRLRHRHAAPPLWLQAVGGGWEGRLLYVGVLALAGALREGLLAAAIVLALVYVVESTLSWLRFSGPDDEAGAEDEGRGEELA
jgi:uncharacterized protein DUF5941